MKRKGIKTLVITLIIFTMTATSALPVFAAPIDLVAESYMDMKNESDLSIEQVIENIQYCDSNIEYKIEKLNELKKEILKKEQDIKDNEKAILLAEDNIDDKDKALAERMKYIQSNGGLEITSIKYIDALFSSGDILEAIQKVRLISKICTSDKKLIEEAKEAKENLTEIKEKMEKEKKEFQNSKSALETEIKKLEDDKTKLLDYIKENSAILDLSTSNTVPVTLSSDISDDAKNLINEAQKYLGIPYLWGGTTPRGFDCSGLMQYVFETQGINIPRVSQEQQSFAEPISISQVIPGDLVFNKSSDSTHVGMYIGNDMYIHAPHTGDFIKISQLSTSNMKYVGRILNRTSN